MKKITDLIDVDILYGIGFILVFAGSASWISGVLTFLNPLAPFGALLIVVGAIKSLFNKFSK